MARPDLHAGLADLALAGKIQATTDEAQVLYDQAWQAQITAKCHAEQALRLTAAASRERQAMARAMARPPRQVRVQIGRRIVQMTEAEYHAWEADRLSAIIAHARQASDQKGEEGGDLMRQAVEAARDLTEEEQASLEAGQQATMQNPTNMGLIRRQKAQRRRGLA